MPTFTLAGFVVDSGTYVGPGILTLVLPNAYQIEYEISNETNNPGFGENGLGINEAFFPSTNSDLNVSPVGDDPNDLVFLFDINLVGGEVLTVLEIEDAASGQASVFILQNPDNVALPTNSTELAALQAQIDTVTDVAAGPFSAGNNFDFSQVWATTLLSTSQADRWTGTSDNEEFFGGVGADRLSGEGGTDFLSGGNGRDKLSGGSGDDTLVGNSGDDRLTGGSGNDSMSGGGANDNLLGGSGRDTLRGGDGADSLDGGSARDRLYGDLGRDSLEGGTGNDYLNGGAGRDTLNGGSGNDLLIGGSSADVFVFEDGHGNDRIRGFNATNNSEDIDLSAVTGMNSFSDVAAAMADVGGDVVITTASGTITLLNTNIGDLDADDFIF